MHKQQQDNILTTQALKPGMVIIRVVQQNGPIKIKKSGLVTSQEMIQGLIEMGIQQVEVDHHQTVEIDTDQPLKIKKSATRRMLESDTVINSRIDDGLSDQYHRSLFLPSVQDLPSAWQYYVKRYVQLGIIAIGGFGLGLTAFNYQSVFTVFPFTSEPVIRVGQNIPLKTADVGAEGIKDEIKSAENQLDDKTVTSHNSIQAAEPKPKEHVEPATVIAVEQEKVVESAPAVAESRPNISAELIDKFNKAIAQVADEPDRGNTQRSVKTDVLRIDQLPAWVMTTLPSMSFSAHMYASEPSQRWVRVNGTKMFEGDVIADKVQIIRIEPQHVILEYSGQDFSMAALTDW
ncbi:general secretion pathway protein GspB [Paraglaciecola sp. L3A3]|uniref:general secretion pathway protein GspB n=1 Tax=Paraglaciecola sp. L3A3 TaxID=2686358 RepID=UPI00131EA23F|nr:general secretion pathway protein GspB [Paraglaciecola sp. L3A3]